MGIWDNMQSRGDADALYALGISFATGTGGVAVDLVAAHKWFNLAAGAGLAGAADARQDVADEMTPRQIAEAQRQARSWLAARTGPRIGSHALAA